MPKKKQKLCWDWEVEAEEKLPQSQEKDSVTTPEEEVEIKSEMGAITKKEFLSLGRAWLNQEAKRRGK